MRRLVIAVSILLICNLSYAGNCVEISQKVWWKYQKKGIPVRFVYCYIDDEYHRAVERYERGKWRVHDDAIWYIGKSSYTAEETYEWINYRSCQTKYPND